LKTVLGPESGGGVVLWLDQAFFEKETFQGLAIATACCENYCEIDPKEGAAHSVMKAARMIAATGAKPLAITDCLNYGNPDDPEIMWQFSEGVDGITEACNQLKIPVVSGNVSFYNQTNERSILPTPMIGMVGEIDDVRKCIPAVTNEYGCLYLLAPKAQQPSFAGSLIADMIGCEQQGSLLAIDYPAEKEAFALLQLLVNKKYLHAAREVGRGGVFCCTMQILSKKQGQVGLITPDQQDNESFLFGERPGAYVLVVDSSCEENFLQEIQVDSKIILSKLGTMTKGESRLIINQEHFNINGLISSLDHALRFL
jgi:phosphoribosylformylglycinamidine synthase